MSTVVERLLKYHHQAVFDTSPDPVLALRIRNPRGLTWVVADGELRLAVGQDIRWDGSIDFRGLYDWGLTKRSYALEGKTIGALAEEIRADGHEVVFENPELLSVGAGVLVDGAGDQAVSNGDHLQGYTSLLWVFDASYAVELVQARAQVEQALRQMVMTQAEGEWLELWAALYGLQRLRDVPFTWDGDTRFDEAQVFSGKRDESDIKLRARIPREAFRLRVNGLAIENAVADVAGQQVTIDEPWRRMFLLDDSALSGTAHLQDGSYYTYHVIQPVGAEGTDWDKALPVVKRNKAGGIEIAAPRIDFLPREVNLQPPVEYRIEVGHVELRGSGSFGPYDQVLGVMRLSDNEITPNHPVSIHEHYILSEADGFQTEQQIEPHRSIAKASIPLSDGAPLGDENAILSRGMLTVDFEPDAVLSVQMMPSGYLAIDNIERVELVTIALHAASAQSPFTASGEVGQVDITAHVTIEEAYALPGWSGGWGTQQWLPDWRLAGSSQTDTPA